MALVPHPSPPLPCGPSLCDRSGTDSESGEEDGEAGEAGEGGEEDEEDGSSSDDGDWQPGGDAGAY